MKHIAEFAVERERDVVYVMFPACIENGLPVELCEARDELIARLDQAGLEWEACRLFPRGSGTRDTEGTIFVDVPYAESDRRYAELAGWFDTICGRRGIEGGELCFFTLARAKIVTV